MLDASESCVRFRLGEDGFGLPLAEVREIVPAGRIYPVPLAPRSIRGLCNVRGRVVTLMDAGALMDRPLPEARLDGDRLALLLAPPHAHLALYVHGPVELGRIAERSLTAGMSGSAAATGAASEPWQEEAGPGIPSRPRPTRDGIVHLVSAADLLARCEAQIRDRFRRRA